MDGCHPKCSWTVLSCQGPEQCYNRPICRQRYHGTLVAKLANRHKWSISLLFCFESVVGESKVVVKGLRKMVIKE